VLVKSDHSGCFGENGFETDMRKKPGSSVN
jgi:hypothetical protein